MIFFRHNILIGIIEIQRKNLDGLDYRLQAFHGQGFNLHSNAAENVLQEKSVLIYLFAIIEEQPNGVEGKVGDEKLVRVIACQQITGLRGFFLVENYFQRNISVQEQVHLSPALQREIWC